jgi:nucleoside-diphosphate-sugar epimerase
MRIAVIGATGMLGHHFAREAHRAGHDVIALYRSPRLLKSLEDVDYEPTPSRLGGFAFAASGFDSPGRCQVALWVADRSAQVPARSISEDQRKRHCGDVFRAIT